MRRTRLSFLARTKGPFLEQEINFRCHAAVVKPIFASSSLQYHFQKNTFDSIRVCDIGTGIPGAIIIIGGHS